MYIDITDRELISLYLNHEDKKAIETLISRHHQKCFEKINSRYKDETKSLNLCKKLWVFILSNPDKLKENDKLERLLDHSIETLSVSEFDSIEDVIDSVHDQYLHNSTTINHSQTSDANSRSTENSVAGKINSKVLIQSSKLKIGIAFLTALSLFVVIALMIPKPKSSVENLLIYEYQSEALKKNSSFLSDNINTNIDWQYGFVIEEPGSHDAFVVGSYMVNLINLDEVTHSNDVDQILDQLVDISLRINNDDISHALTSTSENLVTNELIKSLASSFENYYKNHPELSYFKFGKWVEFNYLHTKLAIEQQDIELYLGNLYTDNKFITHFMSKVGIPHLLNKDVEQIVMLSSNKEITIDTLKQQIKVLGNLRSLLF